MVLGYHIIITAYGFWLPNDPRGSWSDWIRSWELFRAGGGARTVRTSESLAHRPHDHRKRLDAKKTLKHEPVVFNGAQAHAVAMGFNNAVQQAGYVIHACAVMPDHAHVVIARDGRLSEKIAAHLKRAASRNLRDQNLHPFQDSLAAGTLPSPWARKSWSVYLDSVEGMGRAIGYVEENPIKAGLKRQRWSFVAPYEP